MEKKSFLNVEVDNHGKVILKWFSFLSSLIVSCAVVFYFIPMYICKFFDMTWIKFFEFIGVFIILLIVWFFQICLMIGLKKTIFEK